ncbi:MAG: hypothetical protein Q7K28_00390 [Candidatus Wildermuthbacteria bacterium]|nr:hypothetical protein [Candidatus Wildermuthbacteria bacterium]
MSWLPSWSINPWSVHELREMKGLPPGFELKPDGPNFLRLYYKGEPGLYFSSTLALREEVEQNIRAAAAEYLAEHKKGGGG